MDENKSTGIQGADLIKFKDILNICLYNWFWFVISLVVCLGVATYIILKTQPVYSRTMTVLIKPNNVQKYSSSDLDQILSKNGMTAGNTKLVNEKISLSSISLMSEVVRRGKLNVLYSVDGRLHDDILYGKNLPYVVSFLDQGDEDKASLIINRTDKGLELSDFQSSSIGKEVASEKVCCALMDTVSTPIGRIVVSPSPYFFQSNTKKIVSVVHGKVSSIASGFRGRLTIAEAEKESDVLNISFSDISAERAADVLSGVINVYNENWVNDRNRVATSTSQFIKERLATLEQDLGDVDDDISSYKSRNLMPDVSSTSSLYMAQSGEVMRQLQELENQLSTAIFIKDYLQDQSSKNQLIPSSLAIANTNISSQISKYNELLLKRNSVVANSSEFNPIVADMDNSLMAIRSSVMNSIDGQIKTLEAQQVNLRQQENRTNEKIAASPNQAKYLLSVERQQKVKESLYLFLLQKREENELGQAFTAYNTRIINPPIGSSAPVAPAKMKILAIALLIALSVPLVCLYFIKITDTKIRTRQDLESLSIPFVGEIPQHMNDKKSIRDKASSNKNKITLYIKHGKRDVLNEAFRVLRTNLEFMSGTNPCNKIAITSFNVGSGKSFVSINLAAALSINGKKVIAVDADLRHASLSQTVNAPKEGLSNFLVGQVDDLHSIIVHNEECKTLDVLPVGKIPPNPSELVSSKRFAEMLDLLEKEYEYIIFDCPPVEIVADTQIVNKYADRTLFIVRSGLLDKSMLPELEELHVNGKFINMSVILNGTGSDGSLYGYRNGYHYSYKYGYSYYNKGYYNYLHDEDKS